MKGERGRTRRSMRGRKKHEGVGRTRKKNTGEGIGRGEGIRRKGGGGGGEETE